MNSKQKLVDLITGLPFDPNGAEMNSILASVTDQVRKQLEAVTATLAKMNGGAPAVSAPPAPKASKPKAVPKKGDVANLETHMLNVCRSPIAKSAMCAELGDFSKAQVDVMARKLVAEGKLRMEGSRRTATYVAS